MQRIGTIERAFMLASEGSCKTVGDLRAQLKLERYDSVDAHLAGSSVQRQLKQRIATAVAAQPAEA